MPSGGVTGSRRDTRVGRGFLPVFVPDVIEVQIEGPSARGRVLIGAWMECLEVAGGTGSRRLFEDRPLCGYRRGSWDITPGGCRPLAKAGRRSHDRVSACTSALASGGTRRNPVRPAHPAGMTAPSTGTS